MDAQLRVNGDLNNSEALRRTHEILPDPACARHSLAIPQSEDDEAIRAKYRPFLRPDDVADSDWVTDLELSTALKMAEADLAATGGDRVKVMVLFGSMRERQGTRHSTHAVLPTNTLDSSYSRLLAFECARILFRLGCDVRVYDPTGLPMKDDIQHDHQKVRELRELSKWSDGHIWVSPEQHGNLTSVFKNQIDWIPLSTGSVRPTQGRTLAIAQVSGGSQSFNTVNSLRILGRWMRMFTIPNQSSVPKAYTQFTDAKDLRDPKAYIRAEGGSRLIHSSNRDRLVDCMEEFVKYTIIMRQHFDLFGDRYSERVEATKRAQLVEKHQDEKEEAGTEGIASSTASANLVNGVNVGGL